MQNTRRFTVAALVAVRIRVALLVVTHNIFLVLDSLDLATEDKVKDICYISAKPT